MLNACAEAHAFASLMQWKGGILGVLLPEATDKTDPQSNMYGCGSLVLLMEQAYGYYIGVKRILLLLLALNSGSQTKKSIWIEIEIWQLWSVTAMAQGTVC